MGFTPEMIQDFALRFPNEVEQEVPQQYAAAGKFARACGLSPEQLQELLRVDLGNHNNVIDFFALLQTPASLYATEEEFRSSFEATANSEAAPEGQRRAARIVLDYLDGRNRGPTGDS
jgi:hypothetical protein